MNKKDPYKEFADFMWKLSIMFAGSIILGCGALIIGRAVGLL